MHETLAVKWNRRPDVSEDVFRRFLGLCRSLANYSNADFRIEGLGSVGCDDCINHIILPG